MDTILQGFLTWQFLVFALAIGAVVFVIRQLIEYWMTAWWPLKGWKAANPDAKLWRELILPILPVNLGLAAALLATNYPYPEGFGSTAGRIGWGLVAGFTSGMFVRLYKSFLASRTAEFSEKISSYLKPNKSEDNHDFEASVRDSIKKDE